MPQHQDENNNKVLHIMFGGDVMLGRNVKEYIQRCSPYYPLGKIAECMRQADLTIVNLECAITDSDKIWQGNPKAFYFGAPKQAIHSLIDAGIDIVNLANNHSLDFRSKGLLETLHTLHEHDIHFTGAGIDLEEALAPAIITIKSVRFGMAGYCDHQSDFAAGPHTPGMAYINIEEEEQALRILRAALKKLLDAQVDWPILSLHWGPNMVSRPSEKFKRLAHNLIDMGWKVIFGHSAHVFQGIEIYKGCPIIFAAGNLVDDYFVDPAFKNDHQMLFELELSNSTLHSIRLLPVFIEACHTRLATGKQFELIVNSMTTLCSEMGTQVERKGGKVWIDARRHSSEALL
ncbi:CapA family protein [Sulfurirhabdus autotrophica]|uniref:Poly-gamma-glutamate synthesis protein (Capsule biosynthesis protein) n=1 Tax=Sulfurirhabdus autotrophica TaxID=1706046 RepID=A0A4V2W0V2_9PROT|nr:CapA family protein [Sulfurirhabdus autotrophica]TCV80239.1 poly-gamma-glutamate synthesis protein (capsule biosynthesis protein) [Sulfurirhabdus autotrophica]